MYFPSSKWNVISKAIFIVVKYILDSLPSRPFLYKLINFFIIAKSTDCNFKGIRKILPPPPLLCFKYHSKLYEATPKD